MYRHLHLLNRTLDQKVLASLARLLTEKDLNQDGIIEHQLFNDFVQASFSVSREKRPAVSQLSDYFSKYGCAKPGTLACQYAIKLESLAEESGLTDFRV